MVVFTLPKASQTTTSELINEKTITVVILIHGLSLTPQCMTLFFYMDLHSLRNTLVCINLNVSISSSLKFLKADKAKAIYFITNKEGFLTYCNTSPSYFRSLLVCKSLYWELAFRNPITEAYFMQKKLPFLLANFENSSSILKS